MNFRRPRAGLAAAGLMVPCSALAALWTLEPSAEMSLGANTNYGLVSPGDNRVAEGRLALILGASRQTEASSTRLDADLTEHLLRGDLRQDEFLDDMKLTQTLTDLRDTYTGSLAFTRDDTLEDLGTVTPAGTPTGSSSNLILGRGLQHQAQADASWTHQMTERASFSASTAFIHTSYSDLVLGQDYNEIETAGSLQYLLDELDTVTASVSHVDYRVLDESQRTFINDFTVGFVRQLSERQHVSASVGASDSNLEVRQQVLVCPVDPSQCNDGSVQPVAVLTRGNQRRWGVLYDVDWNWALTPLTQWSTHAQRSLDPSGIGVTSRTVAFSTGLNHDFSERLHAGVSLASSNADYSGLVTAQLSRVTTLEGRLSMALTPQWTLSSSIDLQRAHLPTAVSESHAASFQITLRYDGQRLEAHH